MRTTQRIAPVLARACCSPVAAARAVFLRSVAGNLKDAADQEWVADESAYPMIIDLDMLIIQGLLAGLGPANVVIQRLQHTKNCLSQEYGF